MQGRSSGSGSSNSLMISTQSVDRLELKVSLYDRFFWQFTSLSRLMSLKGILWCNMTKRTIPIDQMSLFSGSYSTQLRTSGAAYTKRIDSMTCNSPIFQLTHRWSHKMCWTWLCYCTHRCSIAQIQSRLKNSILQHRHLSKYCGRSSPILMFMLAEIKMFSHFRSRWA